MRIGNFLKTDTGFTGAIETLELTFAKMELTKSPKRGANSPDYVVTVKGIECGAAWNKTSADKSKQYISVAVDDPSLDGPFNFSLFAADDKKSYQALWSRPQTQAARAA